MELIITERLILRKVKESDALPMFLNWASDPEVAKYVAWSAHENVEMTKKIISIWLEEEESIKTIRFMITIKGSDEPFGNIDVVKYIDGNPEIGYCLSRKMWNKGYMSEACLAFIKYLFKLGFNKVYVRAEKDNIASNRVIEKCGFAFTHQETLVKPNNEEVSINCYEINKNK